MTRPVVRYGASCLQTPASPVTDVTDDIRALIDEMVATMHAAPGIGLAAPQVGVPLRICVIDLSVGKSPDELVILINPEFVERHGMQLEEEGCLSLPGFLATVPRPREAVVRALDRNGEPQVIRGTGLMARALQHEIDHLNGRLFIERLRPIRRRLILRRVDRMARAGQWS